jgi:hypothetical protein
MNLDWLNSNAMLGLTMLSLGLGFLSIPSLSL